jgi:hypothetical protein
VERCRQGLGQHVGLVITLWKFDGLHMAESIMRAPPARSQRPPRYNPRSAARWLGAFAPERRYAFTPVFTPVLTNAAVRVRTVACSGPALVRCRLGCRSSCSSSCSSDCR